MERRDRSWDVIRQRRARLALARQPSRDLILLVADKDIDYGLRGLLSRPRALGIRKVDAQTFVHPRRDPGCVREAHDFLRQFTSQFSHAVVVFDYQGCGRGDVSSVELAAQVRDRLSASGWGERAEAIAINPELEAWAFSASPNVEECLGWPKHRGRLRPWLERENLWAEGHSKPLDPRTALERALFEAQRPRSAAIYECLGKRVGLKGCRDEAFQKLKLTLSDWFSA